MDRFTVYCRTDAGDRTLAETGSSIDRAMRKVLELVDGFATVGEISTRIGNAKAVQRALTELERTGHVETLDARMARLTEQEAEWAKNATEMGGAPSVPPTAPLTDLGEPKPAAKARPAKRENVRDVLASGSGASLSDRIKVFFGTLGHRAMRGGGNQGKKVRRILAWVIVVMVVGGIAAALVSLGWQVSTLRPRLETEAAAWLGEPVKIGAVGVAFHPWPSYEVKDLQIGEGGTTRIAEAWGQPDWINWMLGRPQYLSLSFRGGKVNPAQLMRLAGLPPATRTWRLSGVDFSSISFPLGSLEVSNLKGVLEFSDDGLWVLGRAQNPDSSFIYTLTPREGRVGLNVVSKQLKLGASSKFEDFFLEGFLTADRASFSRQTSNWLGGAVKGAVEMDFSQGIRMKADLVLTAVSADALTALVEGTGIVHGNISGPVTVTSEAPDIDGLFPAAKWAGSFTMVDGALGKIGLIEALRRNGGGAIAGGATRFAKMTGSYVLQPGKPLRVDVHRLDAGALGASARVTMGEDRILHGSLRADLTTPVERLGRSFAVEGALQTPALRPAGE